MKKLILPITILCSIASFAQKPIFTQAKITAARVYSNGAELKHKTSAKIPSGTSEIVITNVANYLNENTVQLQVPKYVTVMSVQYSNAYVEEYDNNQDSPLVKPVKEQITKIEKELAEIDNQLITERKSIELLDKNQSMSESNNFSVAELTKLLDFYKTNRASISNNINKLELQKKELNETLKELKNKLSFNQTTSEKNSQGKLIVHIMSSQAGEIPMEISYLTYLANWQPSYEMRIDKINAPIRMHHKAQVSQNTGIDWKNIQLSLTSGQANQHTYTPELSPWFLYESSPAKNLQDKAMGASLMRKAEVVANDDNIAYDEVVALESSSINQYTHVEESQLNMTFNIDIPYTILSNNKQHAITIKESDIEAEYNYISIPKLDTSAFLIAKIKDYTKHNILAGEVSVIFDNTFVGKTHMQPNTDKDELTLSLGRDNNISVSRELLQDKSGSKMLSSKKAQDFSYEIVVKNNKKESISITLEDQIPLSTQSDIEIELLNKDGANYNAETGKLSWDVNLKANESKKIRFGYQVKYPKNMNLPLR